MNNFNFYVRTDVRFGKNQINALPEIIAKYGRRVLIVYGSGSIRTNGIYDRVKELLEGCQIYEISGVQPNPKIDKVREGAKLCKDMNIDVLLPIGGGSTIDAAKVMAAGACYEGDPWDLVVDSSKIGKVLPIVAVLTLAATGSEMNKNAVISNTETNEKLGTSSKEFIPVAAICDPTYLYTLPHLQTAAGTADIMSHVLEQYFRRDTGAYLSDRFAESILKTCIHFCPIAITDPCDYNARANLMWASTMALNGLIASGKSGAWTCHAIEHELSAYYDITHGVGLAIITPRWMRYVLNDNTVEQFVMYARNVWDITDEDVYVAANKAIDATEQFFRDCRIPMTLGEIGIDDSKIELMAADTVKYNDLSDAFMPLTKEDVAAILRSCL